MSDSLPEEPAIGESGSVEADPDAVDAGQRSPGEQRPPADAAPAMIPPSRIEPELPAGTRIVPAAPDNAPGTPASVLSDALSLPAKLEVSGEPMSLLSLLQRARDPRNRLTAIDVYWSAALSWIAAHWSWADYDFLTRLEAMSPAPADEAEQVAREAQFRARLAAASADCRQSEVDMAEAQQRLGALAGATANQTLPLPDDLPHVGAYKTRFETLYAGQPAPERPLVIHRTLPMREHELRLRAEALLAARDALDAAEAGYQQGSVPLDAVLSCLDDQARERAAFLVVVQKYNRDIAEYALATPLPAADDRVLAARLIKPRREDGWRWDPRDPSNPTSSTNQGAAPIAVVPPASSAGQVQFQQPANQPAASRQLQFQQPAQRGQAPSYSRRPPSRASDINPPPRDGAQSRPIKKNQLPDEARVPSAEEPIISWSGLSSAEQALKLNSLLQQPSTAIPSTSLPVSITDCVIRATPVARQETIGLYWRTCESMAQQLVFSRAAIQLEQIQPLLLNLRGEPLGNLAMLRCRTAQLENEASRAAVAAVLAEQRVRLTAMAGHPVASQLAVPLSVPRADALSVGSTPPPPEVARLHSVLGERAAAVVAGSVAREEATRNAPQRAAAAIKAIDSTSNEAIAALEFLDSVTRYNQALAVYALSSLPSGATPAQIQRALGYDVPRT